MTQGYKRQPRQWRDRPFDDPSPHDEATASMLVARWRDRKHGNVPQWLYPKLVERAYRLVEDPSTPYRLAGAAGGHAWRENTPASYTQSTRRAKSCWRTEEPKKNSGNG